MKTRRGKRSESFWPSIVMKKWLNIQPKVYDFSEDEVDTETESDDDGMDIANQPRQSFLALSAVDQFLFSNFCLACSVKDVEVLADEEHARRIQGNLSVCATQTPGIRSKGCMSRHSRGKSETLRLQYINTKDVWVTIGTWNVAGRLPYDNIEIDEWLNMKEPADIYILGFQEVVPLNAGNVLGAETRRPIPKWEGIIRRTLNRSSEPEAKHKSYSAPPSPVLRTSFDADLLADEIDNPAFEMFSEGTTGTTEVRGSDVHKLTQSLSMGKKLQLKRIYGIDSDSRLDWPEHSLDTTPQVLSSNFKLRRVFSSSARVGSDWMQNPLASSPLNTKWNVVGLNRLHHSSGDLRSFWMDQDQRPENLDLLSHVSDEFSEEEDNFFLETSDVQHENGISKDGEKSRHNYVRIVSKQMVGIYVSVWVRRRLRRHINNLKVSPVGVGLMGYMGNKGSVSVSMSLFQTRLCFVCSHLTSGQKDGDEQRRNSDVHDILRKTRFSSGPGSDQPQTIPSHDKIFWFGDLNYRLNMLDSEVRKLVATKQWDELLNSDQLSKELHSGHVFEGWKEGPIAFPPTYKYAINSDRYVGENPKEGEKKRSPAWCDRILWLGKGIKQLAYGRAEIRLSDHRPVSSNFLVEVEVFDQRKLQRALNFTTAAVHPEIFLDEDEVFDL